MPYAPQVWTDGVSFATAARLNYMEAGIAAASIVVNVKEYGAKGDGATNDTAAIEAAATGAGTNGTLRFPAGVYKVANVKMKVAGQSWILEQGAELKLIAGANVPTLTVEAAGCEVTGLGTINGTLTEQSSNNTGVYIKTGSAANCVLSNISIINAHGEAAVIGGDNRTTIFNCTISNSEGHCIFLHPEATDLVDITIEGNLLDRSMVSAGSAKIGYGVVLHGTANLPGAGHNIRRARVSDNRVLLPVSPTSVCIGIELALGCIDGQVVTNFCESGTMGISISGSTKTVVTGNNTYNNKIIGIELALSTNCTVTGNQVDGNGLTEYGIDLDGLETAHSEFNTISGNTVQGCTIMNIFIIEGKYNTIIGNTLYVKGLTVPLYVQGKNATPIEMNTTVVGNVFYGNKERQDAIVFDGSNGAVVTGNTAFGFTRSFVFLFASSEEVTIDNIKIGTNLCKECTALLAKFAAVGSGVRYVYAENGFAPPGVEVVTVTGSPFTYTNKDNGPETLYVSGGTISAVAKNGQTLFAVASDITLSLEGGDAVTITYTIAPTAKKDRK